MTKNKQYIKQTAKQDTKQENTQQNNQKNNPSEYPYEIPSREQILALFVQHPKQPLTKEQIAHLFDIPVEHFEGLRRRLRAMENDAQLSYSKQGYQPLNEQMTYIGTVIGHRDGIGFLHIETINDNEEQTPTKQADLILSHYQMKSLLPGDRVKAHKIKSDRKGRDQATVIKIIEPFNKPIVGRLFIESNIGYGIPEDKRFNHEIIIPPEHRAGARQGQVILIEIVRRPDRHGLATGRVIEVLGDNQAPGMEIQIALRTHNIPHTWPKAVTNQIKELKEEVPEEAKKGRIDLRDLPLVTIDGEDARDFDDAVYCKSRLDSSGNHIWTLWVAIADVSYYVRPKTALDNEAINRGNSVYFPAQVIPMLPELLSNGLCSLNPQVDRLCMVCEMEIDHLGELTQYKHYEAVMNSHARLTYNQVATMLDTINAGKSTEALKHTECSNDLVELQKLYYLLKTQREKRGAVEFETTETRFIFNYLRKIERIEPVVRNDAHKMIEECMILANVASARFVAEAQEPALYRVHQQPSEEKLTLFKDFLAVRGLTLTGGLKPTPKDYMHLVQQIENRPDKEVIQTMLLRSMMQATYQADNIGHFGLSLNEYAHFTSPIRRYPDLLLHRAIKYQIAKQKGKAEQKPLHPRRRWTETGGYHYLPDDVDQLGEQCAITERRADDATRDVSDWLKCEFMQDHVGDLFEGVVAAVTSFGLFIRLGDYQIDGLLHISNLSGEYFHFDNAKQKLVGEQSGKTYSIGDKIKVTVQAVNLDQKMIDLGLPNAPNTNTSHTKRKSKPKKGQNKKEHTLKESLTDKTVKEKKSTKAKIKPKVKAKTKAKSKQKKQNVKNS